jgi:hypothetical protein
MKIEFPSRNNECTAHWQSSYHNVRQKATASTNANRIIIRDCKQIWHILTLSTIAKGRILFVASCLQAKL